MIEGNKTCYNVKRVGIFGAGKMALHHIKAISLLDSVKLVAIADPAADRENLKNILQEGVTIYSTPEELLESIKPDIVHICTPPHTHANLAKLALKNNAHVYLEKPFSLKFKEAEEVISLANDMKLKVCAGHQLLFESHMIQVKKQLDKIGRIVHVESYFSFRPVRRSNDGTAAISPIEQLVDILPHPVYLLQFFMRLNQKSDVPLEISGLHVRSDGNVHGICSCGDTTGVLVVTLTGRPIESYIRIVGTNGSLCAEFVRGTYVTHPGPGVSGISKVILPYSQAWQMAIKTTKSLYRRFRKKQKSYPGLLELIGAFYESLGEGKEDVLTGKSITETVAICEEVGNRLKKLEENENRRAESGLALIESDIPPVVSGRGRVLVTGGTGMLGQSVLRELKKNGWDVCTISRKIQPFAVRIPGVRYFQGDLGKRVSDDHMRDVATVVHCAAETAGGKEAHERNSIVATRNLLQAMADSGVKRLIHISSIAVLKTSREVGRAIDEDTAVASDPEERGPYVWGKAESERIVLDMGKKYGIDVRIIRPGPLVDYDAYSPPGRLGREAGPFFILIGKREDRLSLCSVQTAAEVIRLYVEKLEEMPPVLNLIEPDAPKRGELASLLLKNRPDLSIIRIPSMVFRGLSIFAKLLQRVIRPGQKPIDVYAAFASEKYDSSLAGKIINKT